MGTWTMATTSVMPGSPTPADRRIARHAAALVHAAKAGDLAGVAKVLEHVEPWCLPRLIMLFATSANADVILHAAGFDDPTQLRAMHSRYWQLRRAGLTMADMPPHVAEGERMYARVYRRLRLARRASA